MGISPQAVMPPIKAAERAIGNMKLSYAVLGRARAGLSPVTALRGMELLKKELNGFQIEC
jgi:hypothetical protein